MTSLILTKLSSDHIIKTYHVKQKRHYLNILDSSAILHCEASVSCAHENVNNVFHDQDTDEQL